MGEEALQARGGCELSAVCACIARGGGRSVDRLLDLRVVHRW